ncbi:hypothetical protein ACFQY5_14245 [Paeniroseomonas aquatica]|uniref:Uncharacterized protein n=1 Tax=Paeniroseomonas aquatica TaxID=373043 RepID=A0ABT8ADA9_9PROT|nr:hypothetical protein [Paeniroseomonas aquatica]MDN3567523.1 hypothetical protein [Paeniroseomonas aquatica]
MEPSRPAADLDLRSVLEAHAQAAAELLAQPLRPVSDHLAGYVETIWAERPGAVWLTGWVRRDAGQEFPVVLADRRKYAGAMALACYERADLPPDAHAFVGLLQTDWQPGAETTDVFVFLGPELRQFIRSVSPLRLQDGPGFAAEFGRVQALCHAGRVNALRGAMLSGRSWLPDTAAVSGATVEAAVDEILALPGFGCFVHGWLLSPTKRLVRLSVKLADRVLHSLPGSLYFLPRPDLGAAAPKLPGLLDRAGFVAAMTGMLQPEDLVSPVLKAWFSDGTSVNFALEPQVVRRLGHAVPYEAALRFYPALANETFFADFAGAVRDEMAGRLAASQMLGTAPQAERYVIAILPPHPSDARLMVDQLALRLRGRDPLPAVALVAEQGMARAQLPLMADWVRTATGAPCALFTMDDTSKPFLALPAILDSLGARRFMVVGAGAFPDAAAWSGSLDRLMGEEEALSVLTATNGAALAGMVWTAANFRAHLATASPAVGATHGQAFLGPAARVAGRARMTALGGRPDRMLESVDAAAPAQGGSR